MTTTESLDMIQVLYGIRQMYMQVWETAEKRFSIGVPVQELFDWCKHEYAEKDTFLERVIEDFKQVYSAQPEWKWIPVKERLPGEGIYLVTFSSGQVGESSWHKSTRYNNGFDNYMSGITKGGKIFQYEVIAWMPLPEPYKEVKDE